MVLLGGSASEGFKQFVAGVFAAAARLGTDAAVFVHIGVAFTFIGAPFAGCRAGCQYGLGDMGVIPGVTGKDVSGGGADVRAVQIGADALGQLSDHVFTQTGIGAGGTGLRAFKTRSDALGKFLAVNATNILRIGLQH